MPPDNRYPQVFKVKGQFTDIQSVFDSAAASYDANALRGPVVEFQPGPYGYTAPLVYNQGNSRIIGAGINKTVLIPYFPGAGFYLGPQLSIPTVPGITSSGGSSYRFFNTPADQAVFALTDMPAGDINGLPSFTIEFYLRPLSAPGIGTYNICSSAARRFPTESFTQSLQMTYSTSGGGTLNCVFKTTGGTYTLIGITPTVVGVTSHVAMSWDGSTVRWFVNGILQASAATTGTFVQEPFEDFVIGNYPHDWPNAGYDFLAVDGAMDSFRISNGALYTGAFTPPTAKLATTGATRILLNCNNYVTNTGRPTPFTACESIYPSGYVLYRHGGLLILLQGIAFSTLENMAFTGFGGGGLGPIARTALNSDFLRLAIVHARNGLTLEENCYESEIHDYTALLDPDFYSGIRPRFGLNTSVTANGVTRVDRAHITGGCYPLFWGNASAGQFSHVFIEANPNTLIACIIKGQIGANDTYVFDNLTMNDELLGAPNIQYGVAVAENRSIVFNGGTLFFPTAVALQASVLISTGISVTFVGIDMVTRLGCPELVKIGVAPPSQPVTLINIGNGNNIPLSLTPTAIVHWPGPLTDDYPIVKGKTNATRQLRIEADAIANSTTRVWTAQDGDLTVAGINFNQSWTGIQTFGSSSLRATRPQITTSIDDSSGNEIIITPATASAVNEITVRNSPTGTDPSVEVSGGDANRGLTLLMKGTGVLRVTGPEVITAAVANSFSVGRQGATNPGLNVDASTGSCVTGFNLASLAAGSGVTFTVTSSGADESAQINAKGAGNVGFQSNRALISSTGKVTSRAGTGASPTTATITHAGALYINTSVVGNVGAGEDDLHSTTIEANTFGENNDSAEFIVSGNWTAGASTRSARLYYAGTLIVALTSASTDQKWLIKGTMIRVDATNMRFAFEAHLSPSAGTAPTQFFARESTITATHANANIFKCTGESSGATNNDVTQTVTRIWKASAA